MFRLSVVRKLVLVAVVALILVGGTLFAQLSDLSDEDPPLGDGPVIGLPITVVHEDAKLTASDAAAGDLFGVSVALSGDTSVAGAPFDDHAGPQTGSAHVFVRSGAGWYEQDKLTASDAAAFAQFGNSVALSGDTAVVGAFQDNNAGGTDAGSAYVFVRDGSSWYEQAKLTASDAMPFAQFGISVALSGDTALVGAFFDDGSGSAYVFVRDGSNWYEQAKLTASDGAGGDLFGVSVALSDDTAVVGAFHDDHAGDLNAGSAYVFVRDGSNWYEQAKLTASDAASGEQFGISVGLSGDTAVVGAIFGNDAGPFAGSAYVYVRDGSSWYEQAKLTASDAAAFDQFGISVAVSDDTAVVGARRGDDNGGSSGSAYVYVRDGTCGSTWCEKVKLLASDAASGDQFGISVAVSDDTGVVGAEFDDHAGGLNAGSAYMFGVPDDDDDDEDQDGDDFGNHLVIEWPWNDDGQGMSELMARDDLLENDHQPHTTDQARLDRKVSSPERTRRTSEHALLTALSQNHSIELRLKIVKELAGTVDISLNALLIAHLERIRAEAEELGKADLVNQAARLLTSLEE